MFLSGIPSTKLATRPSQIGKPFFTREAFSNNGKGRSLSSSVLWGTLSLRTHRRSLSKLKLADRGYQGILCAGLLLPATSAHGLLGVARVGLEEEGGGYDKNEGAIISEGSISVAG